MTGPSLLSNAPQLFFDEAYGAFDRAVLTVGSIDCYFSIGALPVRLRFAGPALVPRIARAFAHLSIAPIGNPALTLCIWDSASTRTPMPSPPWSQDDYREGGEIRGYSDARYYTAFQLAAGTLNVLDQNSSLGIYWAKSAEQIPNYETAAPLLQLLDVWLRRRVRLPIHAGAVGLPHGGVLLAGKGGSGKSNTALACLESRLLYAGDDFCLVEPEPVVTVHSLYCTGKIHPDDAARLRFLAPIVANADRLDTEKAIFFLGEHFPDKMLARFPARAILILRLGANRKTTLSPAPPSAALAALTPGSLLLLPRAARETFQSLGDIVRRLPSYWLDLGSEPREIAETILGLLER